MAFSLVIFALALGHFIVSREKSTRLRADSLRAGGLVAFALGFLCAKRTPVLIGTSNGQPYAFKSAKLLPGLTLAGVLALLTAIIGAVQLRQVPAIMSETPIAS